MILTVGVHVLDIGLAVHQRRNGSDKLPTPGKYVQHRLPVLVKRQPVMDLHLPGNPRMVGLVEVHPGALHHIGDALPAGAVPDRRISNPMNPPAFQVRVVAFDFPNLPRELFRRPFYAGVRLGGAAV